MEELQNFNKLKIGLASASKNATMVLNNLKLVNYFDFILTIEH